MAIRFIQKRYGATTATAIADDATGTAIVPFLPSAAGVVYDQVDNQLKFNKNGHIVVLLDGGGANTTTTNIGAPAGTGTTAVETGDGVTHKTVLTLTALPVSLSDTHVGGGTKIYDFPLGSITITGAFGTVAETTTSAIATTLNSGVTYNWGVGTVQTTTQDSGTLATTEQDIIGTTNGTSSTTINVAAAASTGSGSAPKTLNGTATAADAYFNVGIASAGDIDGDATTTFTGTITILWQFNGAV